MSFWECANEAPKVYQFVGNTPEQVMREAADFLEQARDRGEYLTQWNIAMDEADEDRNEVWYGTLTTNGAAGCDAENDILGRCCAKEEPDGKPKP